MEIPRPIAENHPMQMLAMILAGTFAVLGFHFGPNRTQLVRVAARLRGRA
jgi:hypothetical protein